MNVLFTEFFLGGLFIKFLEMRIEEYPEEVPYPGPIGELEGVCLVVPFDGFDEVVRGLVVDLP